MLDRQMVRIEHVSGDESGWEAFWCRFEQLVAQRPEFYATKKGRSSDFEFIGNGMVRASGLTGSKIGRYTLTYRPSIRNYLSGIIPEATAEIEEECARSFILQLQHRVVRIRS